MSIFSKALRALVAKVLLFSKKIKLLPHVLETRERIALWLCILGAVVSGVILLFRVGEFTIERAPRSGGEYVEAFVGSPSLVNPLFAVANPADLDLTRLIYTGLVRKDAQGNIVPDLAERFTVSTDQKTYTFRLRKGAKWHDGEPVSADDVLFTIARIQDPLMRSPLQQSFRGVAVTKVDDATVQLTLKEAFAPFIETLTIGILPQHLWYDVPASTAQLAEYNVRPIGSGPFRFASFTKDKKGSIKSYALERSTDYYGIRPYLAQIVFKYYADFDSAREALARKEVHGIHFIPKKLREAITNGPYHLKQLVFPQYTAVFFNQEKNKALKDKRVRQALAASVDRERIIREVFNGEATLIASPILPGSLGADAAVLPPTFDSEKANKLLTEAGWKVISPDAYRAKKEQEHKAEEAKKQNAQKETMTNDKNASAPALREVEKEAPKNEVHAVVAPAEPPAETEIFLSQYREKGGEILTIQLTTIDHPENTEVARIVKEGWESIGVRVVLDLKQRNFQEEVITPRDYEALLFGVVVGSDPDPYPFWHSSQVQAPGVNIALFANKEVDVLLEDARRTNEQGIRETKYKRFQEIVSEQLPADFLYTPTYTYLVGDILHGFTVKNIAKPDDRFANITEWYVKTKWVLKKK